LQWVASEMLIGGTAKWDLVGNVELRGFFGGKCWDWPVERKFWFGGRGRYNAGLAKTEGAVAVRAR
jgi:hypothetical protein